MHSLLQHGPPALNGVDASKAGPARFTQLLDRTKRGDRSATGELFAVVYEELRRLADQLLAHERPGQTLQATALVHEAYLRLVGPSLTCWESRAHFFGAAAQAIRRILIDRARARHRRRREHGESEQSLRDAENTPAADPVPDVLELDEALRRLALLDAQKARVVELRFFAGLSVDETAAALGTSPSTVAREWRFARIWLHRELSGTEAASRGARDGS